MDDSTHKKGKVNQRYALVLLVKEILFQLSELRSLVKSGAPGAITRLSLTETCSVLKELPDDLREDYYEILATLTKSPSHPERPASGEVIQLMEGSRKKFVAQIRKALAL